MDAPNKENIVLPKLTPIKQALQNHFVFSCFKVSSVATPRDWYHTPAYTVRDHVVERWIKDLLVLL